jgi:hypothetical protein
MTFIPGIGPKAGLEICKASLRKELNQNVEKFDLIYLRDEQTIKFDVFDYKNEQGQVGKARINYPGEKLKGLIEAALQKYVKNKKDIIKGAKISYEKMSCDIYLENQEGERTIETIKL